MPDFICPRCGQAATEEKTIDLGGYEVTVCGWCYKYLTQNYIALERFKLLRNKENEMAKSKFTPEMDELLIRSYQSHVKPKEIAAKLGLTTRAVCDRASYLKRRGVLTEAEPAAEPESEPETDPEPEDLPQPSALEQAMVNEIKKKDAEIQKLNDHASELMDERDKLLKANYALREGFDAAASTVEELKNELRAVKESGSEILEKLTQKHRELLDEASRIGLAIEMIGKYTDGGKTNA